MRHTQCRAVVMTHSSLSPGPIPEPTQPQTNPRRFIVNAPHVMLHHMTHSHRMHLYTHASASWYVLPQWSVQFSLVL